MNALNFTYNNKSSTTEKLFFFGGEAIEKRDTADFFYVMNNHLGNVLTTVTDRKIPKDDNSDGTIDYFTAEISSTADYYAFGMLMPGRNFSTDKYRLGFNGKEKTDEWNGVTGANYDYGFRIYDSRDGRFLSVDPLTKSYPWYSPYQFAGNKPIIAVDLDGEEEKISIYKIGTDGNVSLLQVINNIAVSDQSIQTPHGKENLLWNITKNRLADGNDVGTTQYKYFQKQANGSLTETELTRDLNGNLVERKGKENPIIEDYTSNYYGTTYIGGNNLKTPNEHGESVFDYRREPQNLVDAAAMKHDQTYDALKAEGAKGAVVALRTIVADMALVQSTQKVMDLYKSGAIDPYTNKPISKKTYEDAFKVNAAFSALVAEKLLRIIGGEKTEKIPEK